MLLFLAVSIGLIAADQLVKYWAFTVLQPQHSIPLLDHVFHLTYVENTGAAFSLFAQYPSRLPFILLALGVAVAAFSVIWRGIIQTALGRWAVTLIAAGALGNAIDRLWHGFVVDLFDFRLIHFPVFNIADVCICTGGALFIFYMLHQHQDGGTKEDSEPVASGNPSEPGLPDVGLSESSLPDADSSKVGTDRE